MIRKPIDVSSMNGCARMLCVALLTCGAAAAGAVRAQSIPADAEPDCRAVHIVRTITLTGRYALDYGDESIGSDVWFEADDASARRLPERSQRAGVIDFTNQRDAMRSLRMPAAQPDGVCRLEGRATIVIRDLETACPGLETPDRARLVKVISAGLPVRRACDAAAP